MSDWAADLKAELVLSWQCRLCHSVRHGGGGGPERDSHDLQEV